MTPEEDLFKRLSHVQRLLPTAPLEGSAVEQGMRLGDPDASTPVTIRNLFTHHDAHPIVIDFALLRSFGLEWLGWEAETVWAEVQRVFKTQISELTRAKIQTVKSCHISNGPWEHWQVFEKIMQGLNNNIPRFDLMQAPTIEQLYAGVDILEGIRQNDFSDEVRLYMAASVLNDEVIFVPPPLDFIQVEVSHPYYVCKDCGNEDLALFHDGICDTCTQRWLDGNMGGRASKEALEGGRGRNVHLVLRYDPDTTQKLWDEVKDQPSSKVADLPETAEGTQVAKLLMARDYMNVRRRQMADQLTALKTWLGAA
jgi:hypothetical protein